MGRQLSFPMPNWHPQRVLFSKLALRRLFLALFFSNSQRKKKNSSHDTFSNPKRKSFFSFLFLYFLCHCCYVTWLLSTSGSSFANEMMFMSTCPQPSLQVVGVSGQYMGTLEGRFDQRHQYITYMSCMETDLPKSLKTDYFLSSCWIWTAYWIVWSGLFSSHWRQNELWLLNGVGEQHVPFPKGLILLWAIWRNGQASLRKWLEVFNPRGMVFVSITF